MAPLRCLCKKICIIPCQWLERLLNSLHGFQEKFLSLFETQVVKSTWKISLGNIGQCIFGFAKSCWCFLAVSVAFTDIMTTMSIFLPLSEFNRGRSQEKRSREHYRKVDPSLTLSLHLKSTSTSDWLWHSILVWNALCELTLCRASSAERLVILEYFQDFMCLPSL